MPGRSRGVLLAVFVAWLLALASPITAGAQVWAPTSTVGAPSPRWSQTAVWTGSRMIVWGGYDVSAGSPMLNTGGAYDPTANTWAPTSTLGAPAPRYYHTALWTGSRMIVWGGNANDTQPQTTGALYDPATDTWTPTSTVASPIPRQVHSAVWTGTKMMVWGGWGGLGGFFGTLDTGGIYDPATDSWAPMTTIGAPSARQGHTAVWTGSRMIVWGGTNLTNQWLADGGVYDPSSDSWTPTSAVGAPSGRQGHTAVWTGSKMIVWGGSTNYEPVSTGALYDPETNTWSPTPDSAPSPRRGHTAVWTGAAMIVWGGEGALAQMTGGILDPASNSWTPTAVTGAPSARLLHAAAWTGGRMIVWGGTGVAPDASTDTGGIYDPQGVSARHTAYYTVPPCRVLDTRDPSLGGPNPLGAGANRTFTIASACGVPATAQAVSLNVTATQGTAGGDLRLYPLGTMLPMSSAINYAAGQTRANNAVASLGDGGALGAHVDQGAGTVHLILDVNGYFE